jgi:hypothetical protein
MKNQKIEKIGVGAVVGVFAYISNPNCDFKAHWVFVTTLVFELCSICTRSLCYCQCENVSSIIIPALSHWISTPLLQPPEIMVFPLNPKTSLHFVICHAGEISALPTKLYYNPKP